MTYEEALNYLSAFQFHGFRLGLERIEAILQALGNPHRSYPCVHVAGTNGKGSVCATVSEVLKEAGYKVGLYTSPHLYSLTERFRVDGVKISEEDLAGQISRIRSFVENGYELSYFEYTTALAFQWFHEQDVDIAVVETGLGGRLDATNVITPLASIITTIGLDHQAFLGDTLEKIAAEKAGIIKKGVPVISGVVQGPAKEIIDRNCMALSSELWLLHRDFDLQPDVGGHLRYKGPYHEIPDIVLGLPGRHQIHNTALALALTDCLWRDGFVIPFEAIRKGVRDVRWPGRGEILNEPVKTLLDGAHNMDGIRSLKRLIQEMSPTGPRTLLWACSNEGGTKDFVSMLRELSPLFDELIITEPPGPRAPVTVKEWKKAGLDPWVRLERDWEKALDMAVSACGRDGFLCVAGSLYLIGAVRMKLMGTRR